MGEQAREDLLEAVTAGEGDISGDLDLISDPPVATEAGRPIRLINGLCLRAKALSRAGQRRFVSLSASAWAASQSSQATIELE